MLSGVTESCFVLSYVLVLGLELSRLILRMPWRMGLVVALTSLGLIAHVMYLIDLAFEEISKYGPELLLARWYDWSLMASCVLALVYLAIVIRRPETSVGAFILPLVLAFIALAMAVKSSPPFDRATASTLWRSIHGVSLLLGTSIVTLGFSFALMYLFQARRLKLKRGMSGLLRLPSLEYLHSLGKSCLVSSAICIALGLLSGLVMNLHRQGFVAWSESGIVFSAVLLGWLIVASVIQGRFVGRGGGRQTALLNIVSFVILALALVLVVVNSHGRTVKAQVKTFPIVRNGSSGGTNQEIRREKNLRLWSYELESFAAGMKASVVTENPL